MMDITPRPYALLLLLLLSQPAEYTGADVGGTKMIGIEGESITFSLGIPEEQLKSVTWTVNQTHSLVNVEAGTPPTILDKSYEGRLRVPARSDSLQLTTLRMEDMGTYRAQVTMFKGTMHRQFTLRVYRQVPVPTITCDSVTCGNETCDYNLSCTVKEAGENVTYRWTHPAGGAVVSSGPILRISLRDPAAPLAVTCTAQNPVSNNSTTVSPRDFCAAPAPSTSLSYCRVKGVILLLVLGALSAGVIVVHFLPSEEQRRG